MRQEQLEAFKQWFTAFAAEYYTEDDAFLNQNIKLKECHTHRVCGEMKQLASALALTEPDAVLAESIALFHDVGRFPQFKQYRTYKDTVSENHCLLSLKVLAEQSILAEVSADERAIIEEAVRYHGALKLPAMDDRTLMFAKMIRDTDKIDIFNLLIENYRLLAYEPDRFTWELEFPDTPECSEEIVEAILNNRMIDYAKLKTVNDAKLLQLGWVFDIYFDYSLRQIYERGYLQGIIDLLPKTETVERVASHILGYVQKRV